MNSLISPIYAGLLAFLLLSTSLAEAQIYQCNGEWTNKACGSQPERTIKEVTVKPETTSKNEDNRAKESLLHELRMQAIAARRDYNVEASVSYAETICKREETTLEKCKEEIDKLSDRIERKTTNAALIQAKQPKKAEQKPNAPNQTVVVVQPQNRRIQRFRNKPYYQPHINQSGVSLGVNGTFQGSQGSISVGGSAFSINGTPRRIVPRRKSSLGGMPRAKNPTPF